MINISCPPSRQERRQARILAPRAGRYRAAHPSWRWPPGSVVLGLTPAGEAVCQPADMRTLGTHIIRASGRGTRRLAEQMLRQDFLELDGVSRGALLIDPHGSLAINVVNWYVVHGLRRLRPIRI